jgi:hypothetical protein
MSDAIRVAIAIELRKTVRLLKADPDEVLPVGVDRAILYKIFEQLSAKSDLLSIVGSYGGSMPDEWVLEQLRRWNARREAER